MTGWSRSNTGLSGPASQAPSRVQSWTSFKKQAEKKAGEVPVSLKAMTFSVYRLPWAKLKPCLERAFPWSEYPSLVFEKKVRSPSLSPPFPVRSRSWNMPNCKESQIQMDKYILEIPIDKELPLVRVPKAA